MNEYEAFVERIEHIREWLDLGVFWDSIVDPAESADLGSIPNVK